MSERDQNETGHRTNPFRRRVCGLLVGGLLTACGPTPADFVGTYEVAVDETFSSCTRGTPAATLLPDQSSLKVREGLDETLTLELWDCLFQASILEAGHLQVTEQQCAVSLDDPTARIEVSGEALLSETEPLSILLEGTYTGTDAAGFKQECHYTLDIASPASAARQANAEQRTKPL